MCVWNPECWISSLLHFWYYGGKSDDYTVTILIRSFTHTVCAFIIVRIRTLEASFNPRFIRIKMYDMLTCNEAISTQVWIGVGYETRYIILSFIPWWLTLRRHIAMKILSPCVNILLSPVKTFLSISGQIPSLLSSCQMQKCFRWHILNLGVVTLIYSIKCDSGWLANLAHHVKPHWVAGRALSEEEEEGGRM